MKDPKCLFLITLAFSENHLSQPRGERKTTEERKVLNSHFGEFEVTTRIAELPNIIVFKQQSHHLFEFQLD